MALSPPRDLEESLPDRTIWSLRWINFILGHRQQWALHLSYRPGGVDSPLFAPEQTAILVSNADWIEFGSRFRQLIVEALTRKIGY